jgi:hypothetical protein
MWTGGVRISSLLFEHAWRLALLLAVVQIALLVAWSRSRSRTSSRAVGIGFAAIVLLPALSLWVVTPREQLIGLCRDLAVLVDAGNVTGIGAYLADDFETAGLDGDAFLVRVEQRLTQEHVDHARLRRFEVAFADGGIAHVVFDAICSIRSENAYYDRVQSRWRVTFRKRGRVWRVVRIEALDAPFSPIRNIEDWLP